MSNFIPNETKRFVPRDPPWIIKSLKAMLNRKNRLGTGENIFVKSFPGAKTSCMHDYVKPSLKLKSDLFILHCGTNDLKSENLRK